MLLAGETYDFLLLSLVLQVGSASSSESLLERFELLGGPLNVLESQLILNDFHVSDGVHIALDVNDLGVVKGSDDLEDAVDGSDVGQESIAQACTGGGTLGQTSNIDAGEEGRNLRFGLVHLA